MEFDYDEKDVAILSVLDENSRLSYREIAKKLGMHPNTVMDRVKRMEKEGVIERYTIRVDYPKLGYKIKAVVFVDIEGKADPILKNISKMAYVHYVYAITGEYDGMTGIVCTDIAILSRIVNDIAGLPGVQRVNTRIVLGRFGKNDRFEV